MLSGHIARMGGKKNEYYATLLWKREERDHL
jgi:hypothetical protein